MLVDFKINNFRSFKNEQCFSMQTGERLRKFKESNTMVVDNESLIKSAFIFGANANGKTNLINALMMLKNLIVRPTTDEIQSLQVDTFGYNNQDTEFEITFIKDKHEYSYLLRYNSSQVVEEKLDVDNKAIFIRNKQNFEKVPEQLSLIVSNVRKNQLLIYFAQQNNESNSKNAYSWFVEDLVLVNIDRIPNVKFKAIEDNLFKRRFLNFLQAADFNIVDVDLKERTEKMPNPQFIQNKLSSDSPDDEQTEAFIPTVVYDVYSTHGSENGTFTVYFNNESTGTKVFMILALYILTNSKKTLIIDEFNRSFHLELAQALIELINSKEQTNQFILTTHELSLMDSKLRQDQIWFAEKNSFGESELFSLFDFDDPALKRGDFNYKKRYLEGRYGATQMVNSGLLMEALKGE